MRGSKGEREIRKERRRGERESNIKKYNKWFILEQRRS
jgi:hypothetical protein